METNKCLDLFHSAFLFQLIECKWHQHKSTQRLSLPWIIGKGCLLFVCQSNQLDQVIPAVQQVAMVMRKAKARYQRLKLARMNRAGGKGKVRTNQEKDDVSSVRTASGTAGQSSGAQSPPFSCDLGWQIHLYPGRWGVKLWRKQHKCLQDLGM